MKTIINFLIFFTFMFLVNISFYYISEDYRFFLKKLKKSNQVVYLEEKTINDDYNTSDVGLSSAKENIDININNNEIIEEKSLKDELWQLFWASIIKVDNTKNVKVVLWKWYKDILNLFKEYDLKEIEDKAKLFDFIDEYPDLYYEYHSINLSVYFFTTKNYNDIYDIFNLLQEDKSFKLNWLNNFLTNSFYINLREDISDSYVRLIIEDNWIVFWLKIKKDDYNKIKQILLDYWKK